MERFEAIAEAEGDTDLKDLYQEMLVSGFGDKNPYNWFTSQSTRPDILAGTWAFTKGMLLQGELPMMVKQMVATAIASSNDCDYCRILHGNTLSTLGVSEEIVKSCVNDPELKAVQQPHRAIIKFALKLVQSPQSIDTAELDELRSHGISKEETLEIIALSAYCNFINTWADISRVQPENDS